MKRATALVAFALVASGVVGGASDRLLAAPPVVLLDTYQEVLGPSATPGGVWRNFILYDPDAPGASTNGPYRMWYGAFTTDYNQGPNWVEHAWSWDGVVWTNRQVVHTADPRGDVVSDYNQTGWPVVVKDAGGYRLYHWRYYYGRSGGWDGCVEVSYGSTDGLSFTGHVEHAMDPLYIPGGWDNYLVCPGSVLLEGGQSVMYYWTHGDYETNRGGWLGRAVSGDGLAWPSAEGPDRQAVMAKGPTGAWDWFQFGPSVVLRETTGEYWMFFVGQTSQDPVASSSCIGFARSTDGVNWTDKSQLFTEQDLALLVGTSVDRVGGPRYFRDPQDGTEYLYFDYLLNSGFAKIGRVVIVPEPGTLVLLAVGVTGALAGRSIRKRQG